MVRTANTENLCTKKRSKSIVVDSDVRACINCDYFEQHFRKNRGNIDGIVPITTGVCLLRDKQYIALRRPCKEFITRKQEK